MSDHSITSTKNRIGWMIWTIVLALLLCSIVTASIYVIKVSIKRGVSSASQSFNSSFESASTEAYSAYYQSAFEWSEAQHHVHNDMSIIINTIREKSSLEVLHVSDVVFVIDNMENSQTSSWLKVPGTGVFTINLTAAEYIVDNARHYVLVRVPTPVLDTKSINLGTPESLRFSQNIWERDNSIRSGQQLAQNQLSEAKQRIQSDFEANEQYSKLAKSSAETMIIALIKGVNPDIDDLQVEVEFY